MSDPVNSLNFNQSLQYCSGFPAHVIQPYKIGKAYEEARDKQFHNAVGDRVKTGSDVKWIGLEVKYTEHQTQAPIDTEIEFDNGEEGEGENEEGAHDEEKENSPNEGFWSIQEIQRTQHVFESTEIWRSALVSANTMNKRNTLLKINTMNPKKFQDSLLPTAGSNESSQFGSSFGDAQSQGDSQTFKWRIEGQTISKILVYVMYSQRSHYIGGFEMILHGGEKINTFMNRTPPIEEIFQIHEINIASQETAHSTPCILVGIETAFQKRKDGFHAIEFGFVSQEDLVQEPRTVIGYQPHVPPFSILQTKILPDNEHVILHAVDSDELETLILWNLTTDQILEFFIIPKVVQINPQQKNSIVMIDNILYLISENNILQWKINSNINQSSSMESSVGDFIELDSNDEKNGGVAANYPCFRWNNRGFFLMEDERTIAVDNLWHVDFLQLPDFQYMYSVRYDQLEDGQEFNQLNICKSFVIKMLENRFGTSFKKKFSTSSPQTHLFSHLLASFFCFFSNSLNFLCAFILNQGQPQALIISLKRNKNQGLFFPINHENWDGQFSLDENYLVLWCASMGVIRVINLNSDKNNNKNDINALDDNYIRVPNDVTLMHAYVAYRHALIVCDSKIFVLKLDVPGFTHELHPFDFPNFTCSIQEPKQQQFSCMNIAIWNSEAHDANACIWKMHEYIPMQKSFHKSNIQKYMQNLINQIISNENQPAEILSVDFCLETDLVMLYQIDGGKFDPPTFLIAHWKIDNYQQTRQCMNIWIVRQFEGKIQIGLWDPKIKKLEIIKFADFPNSAQGFKVQINSCYPNILINLKLSIKKKLYEFSTMIDLENPRKIDNFFEVGNSNRRQFAMNLIQPKLIPLFNGVIQLIPTIDGIILRIFDKILYLRAFNQSTKWVNADAGIHTDNNLNINIDLNQTSYQNLDLNLKITVVACGEKGALQVWEIILNFSDIGNTKNIEIPSFGDGHFTRPGIVVKSKVMMIQSIQNQDILFIKMNEKKTNAICVSNQGSIICFPVVANEPVSDTQATVAQGGLKGKIDNIQIILKDNEWAVAFWFKQFTENTIKWHVGRGIFKKNNSSPSYFVNLVDHGTTSVVLLGLDLIGYNDNGSGKFQISNIVPQSDSRDLKLQNKLQFDIKSEIQSSPFVQLSPSGNFLLVLSDGNLTVFSPFHDSRNLAWFYSRNDPFEWLDNFEISIVQIVCLPGSLNENYLLDLLFQLQGDVIDMVLKRLDLGGLGWLALPPFFDQESQNLQKKLEPREQFYGQSMKRFVEWMLHKPSENGHDNEVWWTVAPSSISKILPQLWLKMTSSHPSLAFELLQRDRFMPNSAQLNSFLAQDINAINEDKTPTQLLDSISTDPTNIWRQEMTQKGKELQVANSKVILYQGAASNDDCGLVAPLLLHLKGYKKMFDTPPIRSIIQYQSHTYGKFLLLPEFLLFVSLLISFLCYSLSIAYGDQFPTSFSEAADTFANFIIIIVYGISNLVVLAIVVGLKLRQRQWKPFFEMMFIQNCGCFEFIQFLIVEATGAAVLVLHILFLTLLHEDLPLLIGFILIFRFFFMEFIQLQKRGIKTYFLNPWNILDIFMIALFVAIFAFEISGWNHGSWNQQKWMSSLVVVEILLLSFKLIGYLRAFKSFGPTVQMIIEVFKDSTFFLILLGCIFVIFGLCFVVIFGKEIKHTQDPQLFSINYLHLFQSLLVTSALGDNILDDIFESEFDFILGPIWIFFVLIAFIVLLNLFIAILTSSYEKIKMNENARFLAGLAAMIDDVLDSTLQEWSDDRLRYQYVHVLEPNHYDHDTESQEWQGVVTYMKRFIPQTVKQELHDQLLWFENRQQHLIDDQLQHLKISLDDKYLQQNTQIERKQSYPPKYLLAHQQEEFVKQLNRFQKEITRIKAMLQQDS